MTAREHIERFNAAVRSGDWESFVATLAPDAVSRFDGVPAEPYVGREAIAAAYAENPPTDTMAVRAVETSGDAEIVRFAWTERRRRHPHDPARGGRNHRACGAFRLRI